MLAMLAALVRFAITRGGALGAGVAIADVINLDMLRQEAWRLAPGSDENAIEEAARTAARALNISGDEVFWPTYSKGDRRGQYITPTHLVIALAPPTKGRSAFYIGKYHSSKSVRAANSMGYKKGLAAGRRSAVQTRQIAG